MYLIRRGIRLILNGSLIFSVRVGQEGEGEGERERRLLFFLIVRVFGTKNMSTIVVHIYSL